MNTFLSLVKRVPWWGYIAGIVFVLILWQSLSGWAMSRKLYNMALDQLREDKAAIVEGLEIDKKARDQIILNLQNQVKDIQKKEIDAKAESQRLRGLNDEKDKEIIKLKKERELIVIPTDPNALADEFRKRGYQPRVIFPSR